jgi:hypothetical protein
MNIRDCVLNYLNEKEAEEFGQWAFSIHYLKWESGEQFLRSWNLSHGHLYQLKESNEIKRDIEKMIAFWKKETKKEPTENEKLQQEFLHIRKGMCRSLNLILYNQDESSIRQAIYILGKMKNQCEEYAKKYGASDEEIQNSSNPLN